MTAEVSMVPEQHDVAVKLGTAVGRANAEKIFVRGEDVVEALMGHASYTEMLLFTVSGRRPTRAAVRVVDAVLVSLVDHGMQPSALAARMTYHTAPDAVQGAIAAGVLGAGSLLLGSMEQCARVLRSCADSVAAGMGPEQAMDKELREILESGRRIPGVGHALHREGDPRASRLLEVAAEENFAEDYVALLNVMVIRAEAVTGRELPLNATGAAAALLLGADVPWELQRGIAIVSRLAGLIAHIAEERAYPVTPAIRQALREASWMAED